MNVCAKRMAPVTRLVSGEFHEEEGRWVIRAYVNREWRLNARGQAQSCKVRLCLSRSSVICSVTSRCPCFLLSWRSASLVSKAGVHVSYLSRNWIDGCTV